MRESALISFGLLTSVLVAAFSPVYTMFGDLRDLGVADGNLDGTANAKIARAVSAVFAK